MMLSLGRSQTHPPPVAEREAAITRLYQEQWAGMVRLALLMLGDRASAEDAVQESFAAVYRRWDKIKDGTRVEAYLRSAVLNTSRSVLRRRKLAVLHRQPVDPPVWSAENQAMLGEDRREVLAALATLPARRREVLVMRFYLHLSDAEIAQTLGITEVSVRSTVSRALKSLGAKLKEDR
ncbi:RNA polymerase sigma factor [Kribbella endophytica]